MIYVDEPQTWNPKFPNYCHMWSSQIDSDPAAAEKELHTFAIHIGLKRSWAQESKVFPHYDLSPRLRQRALVAGAQFVHLTDWIKQRSNYKG